MTSRFRPADVVLAVMLVLYLWPIWSVRRLATQDGPSHVYNAYLLSALLTTPPPRVAEIFAVRQEPVPNLLGHASLTCLTMIGLPPLLAEKVFVSAYLVGVALGARFLLRAVSLGQDAWAVLALPLAYNFLFFMGFYNFLCGIPLVLLLLGLAWRWRDRLSLARGVALSVIVVVIYLAHLVAFGAGVVGLTVVTLMGARRRLAAVVTLGLTLLPSLALVGWYVTNSDTDYLNNAPLWKMVLGSTDTPAKLLDRFAIAVLTPTPRHRQDVALAFVGVLLLVALARTIQALWTEGWTSYATFWATKGAFLVASVELSAVALLFPQNWGRHGGLFTERVVVFAALLSLAWLPTPITRGGRSCVLALVTAISLAGLIPVSEALRAGDRELSRLLVGLPSPPEGTRVLPLFFHARPKDEVHLLAHLTVYLCLRPGVINWDNYEARGFCFPIMFRRGVTFPDLDRIWQRGYTGSDIDIGSVDMAFVGPRCPAPLVDRLSAAFPHSRRCGPLRIYSRAPLPDAGPDAARPVSNRD